MSTRIAYAADTSHRFTKCRRRILQRIMIACLSLLLTIAGATTGHAQTVGKLAGVVKDAQTGEPLVGCNVMLVGTILGASTDIEGAYFILNIPPGKYDLQASMVGYNKVVQKDAIINAGRTTTADFSLSSTTLAQQEVVVQATRPDVEKEKTSTSAIIRAEEVQTIAGIRDVRDVLGLAADVTDGHFRGGRVGEEYYTLQGMGIVNPLDNSSAFLPIMSAVEEVEVITSGFGAQYGNAQSGVVNISMKEGKSDKWSTRVESRMRAPRRKHFGPSVFDPGANVYLGLLLSTDVWLRGDPSADIVQPYYGSMASGLTSAYARDTLVQLAVAQALWMQTRRDLNRNYGNQLDYSIEAGTGGPINKDLRMFIALRSNTEWPTFPTEQANVERQVVGNIVASLGGTSTLRLSGGFTQEQANVFPSVNSVGGYRRWLWDRITGVDYRKRTNLQLGSRFTHTLSPSTFYEIKLNSLFTRNRIGSTPVPSALPDSAVFGQSAIPWSFILPVENNNSPDGLSYLTGHDVFRDEHTRTISLDGSLTSQATKSHLLNAGIQINTYLIDVTNALNIRGGSNTNLEHYTARPFEAAVYVQDKMEFEGFIANVGLRLDFWKSGRSSYDNYFAPYLLPDTLGRFNPAAAPKENAPILGRLQPRIGVSFPVSINTVFHLNYGAFMQRPSFQYVVSERVTQWYNRPVALGNPRLEPETTNSYDIGVTQGLGEGFTLDVSGYYKDVKNLVEQANFAGDQGTVSSYFNRDYADIRGFRIALSKRRGAFTGSINYQYSIATGKSATVTGATPEFSIDTTGAVVTDLKDVPVRDILLDFDRTHNLVVSLGYSTDEQWGPQIFGGYLFGDMTLSSISFFRSGRPYTSPSNLKLINAQRSPAESNTDLKLSKRIRNFFGTSATFYVEVFNVFDVKILNYDYLFRRPTSTNPNLPLSYYEQFGIDDPVNGIRYWWDKGRQGPFALDQSFLIYSNSPRSFSFGMVIDL